MSLMAPLRAAGRVILPLRTCNTRTGAPPSRLVNRSCAGVAAEAPASVSRKVMRGFSRRSASMVMRPRKRSTRSSETLASLTISVCTAGSLVLSCTSSWPRTETSGKKRTRTGPVNLTLPPVHADSSEATRSPKREVSPISQGMRAMPKIRTASRPTRSHFHGSWLGFMPSDPPVSLLPQKRKRDHFLCRPSPQEVLARLAGDSEPAAPDLLSDRKPLGRGRSRRPAAGRGPRTPCDNDSMQKENRGKTDEHDGERRQPSLLVTVERGEGEHLGGKGIEVEGTEQQRGRKLLHRVEKDEKG